VTSGADDELLARDVFGARCAFLYPRDPGAYYGDEQGFTGKGGRTQPRAARICLIKVSDLPRRNESAARNDQRLHSRGHPLLEAIAGNDFGRKQNQTRNGAFKLCGMADENPGILPSRIDRVRGRKCWLSLQQFRRREESEHKVYSYGRGIWERVFASGAKGN